MVSKLVAPFRISPAIYEHSSVCISLATHGIVSRFHFIYSSAYVYYCGLIYIFQWLLMLSISLCYLSFIYLLLGSVWSKLLPLLPFKNWVFVLLLSCKSSLYALHIFWIQTFLDLPWGYVPINALLSWKYCKSNQYKFGAICIFFANIFLQSVSCFSFS